MTSMLGRGARAVRIRRRHDPDPALATTTGALSTACHAPSLHIVLQPNGDVGPCCRNPRGFGNIRDGGLLALWQGRARTNLVDQLAAHDFGSGCEECGAEVDLMARESSYPAQFDHWARLRGDEPTEDVWPVRMELDLSNRCNLQCVQCHGDLSSAIRLHREHRPPLPRAYDDRFFEELRLFIPHLRSVGFAGGEPFLAPETLRAFDLIGELNPTVDCTVVTNGTQWNSRVEAILERLRVKPVISMDGLTAPTYEAIRVGGDHSVVMANLDRFRDYAERVGTEVDINFCLMPANAHELPDLLRFAEQRGIYVNVCIVTSPPQHSLGLLPRPELTAVVDLLAAREAEMEADLVRNLPSWRTTFARVRSWSSGGEDATGWATAAPKILQFARQGVPTDVAAVVAEAAERSPSGRAHLVTVGLDGRARSWPAAATELPLPIDRLEGEPLADVLTMASRWEVHDDAPDRCDMRLEVDGCEVRLVTVPLRGPDGWADEVGAVFSLGPRMGG